MFDKYKKIVAVTALLGMMSSIIPQNYVNVYAGTTNPSSEKYVYSKTVDIGASNLRGIDINGNDKYVVSCPNENAGDGKVYKYTDSGNATAIITGLNFPTSVVATTSSAIYVVDADLEQPKVLKYDSNGQNPVQVGSKGDGVGQYNLPYSIDSDNDGNIYVTDFNSKKILKFNADGTFNKEITDMNTPCGIAVDRVNGYVYVTDMNDYSVRKYNLDLDEETVSDAEWTNLHCPVSLAVDKYGNVFVLINDLESENIDPNSVKKFNSSGKLIATFGETGNGDGQLYADGDIAIDGDGNVYVTDVTNRIQKFSVESEEPEVTTPAAVSVKISGTEKVGNTLSAKLVIEEESKTTTGAAVTNELTTSGAVTYEWYRLDNSDSDFNNLIGTDKTYKLTGSDLDKFIGVIATYDNESYKDVTGKITKDTTTNTSSSSSSSKSKSKTTQITADVTDGKNDNAVSKTVIERTTQSDGTKKDNVQYTADKAQQTVDSLIKSGKDVARIVLPDAKDEVSEANVNIPISTISVLSKGNINLEIDTENARISLNKESILGLSQDGQINGDLYFRLVPVKDEKKQEEIQTRANKEQAVREVSGNSNVQVLGRPMEIETNISNKTVSITLPLKDVTIPSDPAQREAFLKDLGIFIEHSDGEKVVARGEIVEYAPGVLGVKFDVNKFSTFTIIKLNQESTSGTWKNTEQGWKYIKDGQYVTGWNLINGYWYLMDSTGIMETGWQQVNGVWYLLNNNGPMAINWKQINGYWYLLNNDGAMITGWQQVYGKWYYLYSNGSMASNTEIDGFRVDASGAWVK